MKNHIYNRFIFSLCLITSGTGLFAQNSGINYFMDKYTHRHVLNPALTPKWGYVYIPALGPLNVNAQSNLGLSNFLFPLPNTTDLGTFLHPQVSNEQFLSKLHKKNNLDLSVNYNLISFGWFHGSSFWSVDIGIKTNINGNIPYDFFKMVKEGMSSSHTRYDIKDMFFNVNAYAEMALGYSRDIDESWRVGGKLKFLVGAASALVNIEEMNVNMSEDVWSVQSKANAAIYGSGLRFTKDQNGIIDGIQFDNFGIGGYGGAIDLGFEYRIPESSALHGFRFSFALTDLGAIAYSKRNVAMAEAAGNVEFKGFDNLRFDSLNLEAQLNGLMDDVYGMIEFREVPAEHGFPVFLRTNMNAGVEYAFLKDKLSVGLLSMTHFGRPKVGSELMLSFNARPLNWLAVSLSYSFLNSSWTSFGWALHITPKWGLNLFLASDYTFLKFTSPYIPIDRVNFNFSFGLSIPIGNNRNTFREGTAPASSSTLDPTTSPVNLDF